MVALKEEERLAESASLIAPRQYGVLVADDEEGVRGVLSIVLKRQGFVVWLATSGREAIELYQRHHATIDLVLLDVRMPGIDGPQTLAALREFNLRICCCFMSGDTGSYTEQGLLDLGAAAVFRKPFCLDDIAQELRHLASSAAY